LGNLAAGGLSNLYDPATDRGVALTFERAGTVTAEGAIGAIFCGVLAGYQPQSVSP
jgi:hypothetical protein